MRLAITRLAWGPRMFGCLQARDVLCHFLLFGRELFYGRRKLIDPMLYDGETERYRLQLLHEISEKLLQAPQARPGRHFAQATTVCGAVIGRPAIIRFPTPAFRDADSPVQTTR